MVLDPEDLDQYADPYYAWASAQPPPLQVTATEYPLGPIALPPPPPPPPQTIGPTLTAPSEEITRLNHPELQPPPPLPPPPLAADAVSAAAPAATPSDVLEHEANISYEPYAEPQAGPSDYLAHYQSPEQFDTYLAQQQAQLGEQPLPSMREKEQEKQATETERAVQAMTPDEYELFKARREAIALSKKTEAEHHAQLENERRLREDLDIQRSAIAKSEADSRDLGERAKVLASTKINPDRYRQTRGIGGAIRDIASVFLTGLGGNAQLGVQMFDNRIQRDIAAQTADIENGWRGINAERGAIADEYARHGDLYRAQETYRIAAFQAQINHIQTDLQQYDPLGARAIRGRDALEQLHAAQGAALQAFQDKQFKNHLDATKTAIDLRKQQFEEYKFQEQQRAKAAAAGKATKLEDMPLTREQLRTMFPGAEIPEGMPPMTMKQAKAFAETGRSFKEFAKSGEEVSKIRRENAPEQLALQQGVEQLKDVNGNPLKFIKNEKVADAYEASDNAVRLLDELIALREDYGGSTDLMKSPEWRRAHVKFANLLLNQKTRDQLGALTGSDIELEAKKLGTNDPTEWRDPRPGLIEARNQIVEGMNTTLRSQAPGQKPARWDPPPPPPRPPTTPEREQLKQILNFNPKRPTREETGGHVRTGDFMPEIYAQRIDRLIAVMNSPNVPAETRKQATTDLKGLAKDAESEVVRNYAAVALQSLGVF